MSKQDEDKAAREYAEKLADGLYYGDSPMTRARIFAFKKGSEWKEKRLIDKTVEWLKDQKEMVGVSFQEDFIERFKDAMKE